MCFFLFCSREQLFGIKVPLGETPQSGIIKGKENINVILFTFKKASTLNTGRLKPFPLPTNCRKRSPNVMRHFGENKSDANSPHFFSQHK